MNVSAGVINATSAWIRWDPPPVHAWNGELSGYLVRLYCPTMYFYVYKLCFRVVMLY